MPTFETHSRFDREYQKLTPQQRQQFRAILALFIPALTAGKFPPKLRIKRVQGTDKVWEISWDADGRATFEYGDQKTGGDPHIVWRRIGTHDIFRQP